MDALGEVEFRRDGEMRVPGRVPARQVHDLALEFLTPLLRVRVLGENVICYFDTGADTSSLHLPFYRQYRARLDSLSHPDTFHFAGAGGARRMPARILDHVRIAFADTAVTLDSVPVYTESVAPPGERHPRDCRLGLDALAGFDGYLLNLRSMSLLPIGGQIGDQASTGMNPPAPPAGR